MTRMARLRIAARALKSPKGGVREHAGRTQDKDVLLGDL
jgi:hypothetical protein